MEERWKVKEFGTDVERIVLLCENCCQELPEVGPLVLRVDREEFNRYRKIGKPDRLHSIVEGMLVLASWFIGGATALFAWMLVGNLPGWILTLMIIMGSVAPAFLVYHGCEQNAALREKKRSQDIRAFFESYGIRNPSGYVVLPFGVHNDRMLQEYIRRDTLRGLISARIS